MNVLNDVQLRKVLGATATGITVVNSGGVDMQNFNGVCLMTNIGVANAGNFVNLEQANASDFSDAATLAGTKLTPTQANTVVAMDIYKPTKRYVRMVVTRAGITTPVGEIYAMQYQGRKLPTDNVEPGLLGVQFISPDEGAA